MKKGGKVTATTAASAMSNLSNNVQSQKSLIKINYEDLKKVLSRDGVANPAQALTL